MIAGVGVAGLVATTNTSVAGMGVLYADVGTGVREGSGVQVGMKVAVALGTGLAVGVAVAVRVAVGVPVGVDVPICSPLWVTDARALTAPTRP